MTKTACALGLATTLAAAASSAWGQQVAPLSLDLRAAPAEEVLMTFARLAESRLVLSPEVSNNVTFRFDGVSWQTALSAITEGLNAVWELETAPPRVLRIRQRRPDEEVVDRLSISLVRASAEEVFSAFAGVQGLQLEFSPSVTGAVTISLDRVAAKTAQDAVCESVGCLWTRDGERLLVAPRDEELSADLVAHPSQKLAARVSLDLLDADTAGVLSSLATLLGVDLIADDLQPGLTTISLHDVGVQEALDRVCGDAFLNWAIVRGPLGWSLRVSPVVADTLAPSQRTD